MKVDRRQGRELELAEIHLRVAARNYAQYADDPSDTGGVRAKQSMAELRDAAEEYAAAKFGGMRWRMSS